MSERDYVAIESQPIDISKGFEFIQDDAHGGICSFIGTVRNHNFGREVVSIDYEAYEPLAINTFKNICATARKRFGESLKCYVVHYNGKLGIGGVSIAIFVSLPHRSEAFDACRYIIEEIKHKSPIWKKETYTDGETDWVKGHALCQH